MKKEDRKS